MFDSHLEKIYLQSQRLVTVLWRLWGAAATDTETKGRKRKSITQYQISVQTEHGKSKMQDDCSTDHLQQSDDNLKIERKKNKYFHY